MESFAGACIGGHKSEDEHENKDEDEMKRV
jgi:hypothetical protein